MAALAVGLALLALPASVQAQDRGRWGGGDGAAQGNGGDNGRGWRGGNGREHGFRGEQSAPAPAPAPAPQAQPPQRNWSRGNGDGGGGRWSGDNDDRGRFMRGHGADQVAPRPAPAAPAPQVTERRNWQGGGQWQGRNPSYVDPNRNSTYRDPNRDSNRNTVSRWHYDNNGWHNNDSWRGDRQAYGDARNWNRGWRGDNRYDWRGYRDSHRGVYRLGPYYAPYRGYSYRRLGIGIYLDGLFFGSNYWIDDPWSYRLPPAYGPYRWIRYYDDALLVDTYTGEVVDVIYDFFW